MIYIRRWLLTRKARLVMATLLVILIDLSVLNETYGQYENVWVFGRGCGWDFNQSTGYPVLIPTSMEGFGEANASVCDASGQLLFYTNGSKILDRHGDIMPNGDTLVFDPVFPPIPADSPFPDYISSSSQGTIIVPWPEQKDKYYVFSLTSFEAGGNAGRLYFSIVDMRLNGGNGDVIPGEKGIFIRSGLTEHMTGVVGDRCNIWLLVIDNQQNELIAYSINSGGIDTGASVTSPLLPLNYFSQLGQMETSPDRDQLAIARSGICLYDFDPSTGIATGKIELMYLPAVAYNVCFSPGSSKLYASFVPLFGTAHSCYQFDLDAPDSFAIVNSKYLMPQAVTRYKRSQDGKIYSTGSLINSASKGIIHYPDLAGSACQFETIILSGTCAPGGSDGMPGFTNVVPVITYDTFYSQQRVVAPCFAPSISIKASEDTIGWDYVWNSGTLGSALVADTPGTYWVSYHTPPCNYHTDTFHVSFPNGVLPTLFTQAACRSDSNGYAYAYTYPDDPVTYSYTWMEGTDTLGITDTLAAVPSGSYSLHAQTNTGCDTLLFFDIPEEDFRVSFAVSDTLICVGDTIQLTNTSDADFLSYHWALGNDDTTGLSDPPAYVYRQSGAYRLMLAGAGAICKDTAYQTILVDQPLLPAFEIDPKQVCVGQPVHFYPKTDSTTVQLVWEMEEQARTESGIQARYQHGFATGGTFPVNLSVQSRACPDTSITDSIRVYPYPEIDLGPDNNICLHGQPVYLQNLREAPLSPYHQVWSTGDTADILKVTHPGSYTLSVTTEPIGCTTTETITISKDCYIDIPNAFTPNADGHNDYFLPRQLLSESLTRFRMRVFNRWGQLLFETTNLSGRGWDGNFNGKAQPTGVYLYRIETDFSNGQQEKYEGNVTLLR